MSRARLTDRVDDTNEVARVGFVHTDQAAALEHVAGHTAENRHDYLTGGSTHEFKPVWGLARTEPLEPPQNSKPAPKWTRVDAPWPCATARLIRSAVKVSQTLPP